MFSFDVILYLLMFGMAASGHIGIYGEGDFKP
jgi:hypothetical protein